MSVYQSSCRFCPLHHRLCFPEPHVYPLDVGVVGEHDHRPSAAGGPTVAVAVLPIAVHAEALVAPGLVVATLGAGRGQGTLVNI